MAQDARELGAVGQEDVPLVVGLVHVHVGPAHAAGLDLEEQFVGSGDLRVRPVGDRPHRVSPHLVAVDGAVVGLFEVGHGVALARSPLRCDLYSLHF